MTMPSSVWVLAALVAFACLASHVEGAKIMALPYPGGVSHVFIMAKIGRELAERGHEVKLVVANTEEEFARTRTEGSNVQVAAYDSGASREDLDNMTLMCTKESPKACTVRVTQSCVDACVKMFENQALIDSISDVDLVITDISYPCGYAFVDKFNIPYRVEVSPVGFYDPWGAMHWGIPSPTSYVPQLGSKLSNKMSFGERLHNTIVQGVLYAITPDLDKLADDMRSKLNVTKTHTASARSSGMYLLNVDWATEFPRPITPVTKVVGPILPQPSAPLPEPLAAWMDSSANGVLMASLGTIAEVVLTDATVTTLANSFSSLPVNVLWKLRRELPAGLQVGPNVKMVKWFPQNDVLGHPKTRAFFTHGGMNSVQEAAYHGVPMLGFPQFADQFDNIIRMVAAGTTLSVPQEPLEADTLRATIMRVLEEPGFKARAKKVADRMQDRLRSPTQESADWVEFTLRNDNNQHLRVPSLDMPWVQAANLDVYAVLLLVVGVLLWGVFKVVARLAGRLVAQAVFALAIAYLVLV